MHIAQIDIAYIHTCVLEEKRLVWLALVRFLRTPSDYRLIGVALSGYLSTAPTKRILILSYIAWTDLVRYLVCIFILCAPIPVGHILENLCF